MCSTHPRSLPAAANTKRAEPPFLRQNAHDALALRIDLITGRIPNAAETAQGRISEGLYA